jgi:hypothetical protein
MYSDSMEEYRKHISIEEYRKHICMVLRWLSNIGLTLKLSKYEFYTKKTEYLGYIISPTGIKMDPEKIKMVKEWQELVNMKGLQSFIGFTNFY